MTPYEERTDPAAPYDPSLPLPSLLALPLQLQQNIIQHLVESSGPELANLIHVNKYLSSIVTAANLYEHALYLLAHNLIKKADLLFAFLKVNDKLICSLCQFLLATSRFHWNARKIVPGSKSGHKRFCMDCAIKHRKFGADNSIKVDNEGDNYRIVFSCCFEFFDQPPGIPQPAGLPYCPLHSRRWYLWQNVTHV